MLDLLEKLADNPSSIGRKTDPVTAAIIGFLFGGIGLALYFRTAMDTVLLGIVTVVVFFEMSTMSWVVGAAVVSGYGYLRSSKSNARLRQQAEGAPA